MAFACKHCDKSFDSEQRAQLHRRFIHPDANEPVKQSSSGCCSCFAFLTRPEPKPELDDQHPSARAGERQKVKVEYEDSGPKPLVDPESCMCNKQPCVCRPCLCGRSTICVCEDVDF
ncbi:unnamed protein product [Effrenium voratum]|nr:unnamed protein product [Effrenium voratum]